MSATVAKERYLVIRKGAMSYYLKFFESFRSGPRI